MFPPWTPFFNVLLNGSGPGQAGPSWGLGLLARA
jgi:hypothetical protein